MPQISTKPQEARKVIDAGMPKNISAEEQAALTKKLDDAARLREESVARETKTPTESSETLKYQLRKFGRHWNAFAANPKGKMIPLMPAPSLLTSAIDAITNRMIDEAHKS